MQQEQFLNRKNDSQVPDEVLIIKTARWLKEKQLASLTQWMIELHKPIHGVITQCALSFTFIIPLLTDHNPLSVFVRLLSSPEAVKKLYDYLHEEMP